MSVVQFPVGIQIDVTYPEFKVRLTLMSDHQLKFDIEEGPFAHSEVVDIQVVPHGNGTFLISWVEESGATVVNVQDYDRDRIHSFVRLADGQFLRMAGTFTVVRKADGISDDLPRRNKALVLDAMTSLFQRHDASSVERLYAPDYKQHNPNISQGRDALQALVAGLAADVHYEPGVMVAENDYVAIHGRIRGWAEKPQVVVDIFRIEDGKLAEHWDVLQYEVPVASTLGGMAMFDTDEGVRQAIRGST